MATDSRQFYDMPFFYVFDGDVLTDGRSYDRLQIPVIPDSEFHLRRIVGANTMVDYSAGPATGRFQIWTQGGSRIFSNPQRMQNNMAVVPELVYPPGGQIRFDVSNVSRAANVGVGGPALYPQMVFQGVRRYYGQSPLTTPYRYYEKPQTYTVTFTLDYAYGSEFRRYIQTMNEYDFSLHGIAISQLLGASGEVPVPGFWQPLTPDTLKMYLYTSGGSRLSNLPVNGSFYLYNSSPQPGVINNPPGGVFPCPPVVYPVGSNIQFDIYSLALPATVPVQIQVTFIGVWRLPCR